MSFERAYSDRYSALIFDLDDTLLDTYGQLVGPANREACLAMIEAGLDADLETSLQTRDHLFQQNPRQNVFRQVAETLPIRSGSSIEAVAEAGFRAFFHREVETHIQVHQDIHLMLGALKKSYELYLVTSGSAATQQKKIDILELGDYFKAIHLVDTSSDKGIAFLAILEGNGYAPSQVLCIGDRADREIKAANRLGLATCRVLYGEYRDLEPEGPDEQADISITHILQLVEHLEERN